MVSDNNPAKPNALGLSMYSFLPFRIVTYWKEALAGSEI